MADDLRAEAIDVSEALGYRTPILAKLEQKGLKFEHGNSPPLCTLKQMKVVFDPIARGRSYVVKAKTTLTTLGDANWGALTCSVANTAGAKHTVTDLATGGTSKLNFGYVTGLQ